MTTQTIGEISLNVSTFLYLIWFVPQLKLTFERKTTSDLSFWMHALLLLGYVADFLYGFGRDMAWQYRLVTLCGLSCLLIEHFQFWRYGLESARARSHFRLLNFALLALVSFAVYNGVMVSRSKLFYDLAGLISNICWFSFFLPQIIKNFSNKSVEGLSTSFVVISILSGICDVISAFALNWDWPSKMGAPIGLGKKFLLLSQIFYYRKKSYYSAQAVKI